MSTDSELLRRYVHDKSEAAFAELVERHLNLVYAVALRQVGGDAHLAEDVTQRVFVALARKAASLSERPVIGGWLYRGAQFAATDVVRAERRRRVREQKAHAMHDPTQHPESTAGWEKLRPMLDQAIADLDAHDRDLVVLRFFEGRPFAEIGAALKLTEDAARMRVGRTLEKLRGALARRGVTSTIAALTLTLEAPANAVVPAGLAASVTGAALASVGAGAAGILSFMVTSKLALCATSLAAVAGLGLACMKTMEVRQRDETLAVMNTEQQLLRAKVQALEARVAQEADRAAAADDDNSRLISAINRLPPSRAAADIAPAQLTPALVQERYRHAQELARTGDTAGALKEFLWCFDEGMRQVPSYKGVRRSFLLAEFAKLGATDPNALAALRERRDAALQRMLASADDHDAAGDFSSIEHYLKEDARTLQIFDQLTPDDPRRKILGSVLYDQLARAGRYQDAAQAMSYASMNSLFEADTQQFPVPPNVRDPDRLREMQRNYAIRSTATNIEVLAGAGDLEHARTLTSRLLSYDNSAATQTLVRQHLVRAGHADLLTPASSLP